MTKEWDANSSNGSTTSALLWRATPDGRVELDSDAWHGFTGLHYVPSEWGWLDAVHPLDRDDVRVAWKSALATTTPYALRHRLRSRAGGYTWVSARAVPIRKAGIVREWIGMMSDVSERVRAEEARDQFITILGHDIRTPLASIVGGVDLLRDVPEPFAATVARVARSARRIDAIVNDLLDLARGRLGGGIPILRRPCNMSVLCDEVLQESRQAHARRDIRLEMVGDVSGEWDPNRMEQVLANLVGNAVMHGVDPIVVTTRREEDRVVTSVHNHGTPIPEAQFATLFDPFTRGAGTERSAPEGLGLGLYIAREIVRVHGGTLTVTSNAEDGTTFTFSLPRTSS